MLSIQLDTGLCVVVVVVGPVLVVVVVLGLVALWFSWFNGSMINWLGPVLLGLEIIVSR